MGMGSLSNLSALGRVENNNLNGGNGSFGNLSNLSSYGSYGVMGIGDLSLLSQPLSINTPSSGLTMGLYIPHASLVESNVICYPLRL